MQRKHISLKEKLAAALYEMMLAQLGPKWKHLSQIHEMRKERRSAEEVIALYDFDHVVFHAHGGEDKWWNLTPILRLPHREKTKTDLRKIAKGKRIQRKEARHKAAMMLKGNP